MYILRALQLLLLLYYLEAFEEFSSIDLNSLQLFYDSTNGPYWNTYPYVPWNFDQRFPNPCIEKWCGITCCVDGNNISHVQKITLNGFNLSGTIPSDLNLSYMTEVSLTNNFLCGSLPDSLGFPSLSRIDLSRNLLGGLFPKALLKLSALKSLTLTSNDFNGTIPIELFDMPSILLIDLTSNQFSGELFFPNRTDSVISALYLGDNNLNGSIPSNIGMYSGIMNIDFSENEFTGLIPHSIGNLTNLDSFVASSNRLRGPLPDELFRCFYMWELSLDDNNIDGSLPQQLSKMTRLRTLSLKNNKINGPFPPINNQIPIINLYLSNNQMTGPLPENMDDLYQLLNLHLSYNHFTGTIPVSLQTVSFAVEILLNHNSFHGSLLDTENAFAFTDILDLSFNQMTGSIPVNLCLRFSFTQLLLDHNQLDGPLCSDVFNMEQLAIFSLSHNFFSGTIPNSYGSLQQLLILTLNGNLLSGSIPSSLSNLISLEELDVSSNALIGDVKGIFNCTLQRNLRYFDVSLNQLTGKLPKELFSCPSLRTFTALSNCFSGPLPVEMCGATNLTSLVLDGLMSATSCQKRFFKNFEAVVSYGLSSRIPDGIPECLFTLPKLETLHLSGNGLTGSLPENLAMGPSLAYLSLSHNSLRGDIPASMRIHKWSSLDLSYNKITGTMELPSSEAYNIPFNASLTLKVNRLSGKIDSKLRNLQTISILNGNIFECDFDRKELPQEDPDYEIYSCGSNSYNASMYLWCACVGFLMSMTLIVYVVQRQSNKSRWGFIKTLITHWLYSFEDTELRNVKMFSWFLKDIRKIFLWLTLLIVCILLPAYVALSENYDTYTHEYAWGVSGAYLSGVTPSVVLLMLLIVMGCVCTMILNFFSDSTEYAGVANSNESKNIRFIDQIVLMVTVLLNMVIVTGVNIAYVYIVHHYNSTIVQITQLGVAIFKLAWNSSLVKYILRKQNASDKLKSVVNLEETAARNTNECTVDEMEWNGHNRSLSLAVFVILFNNLAAPFFATGYESSNCFHDIVSTPPPVSVVYQYSRCTQFAAFTDVNSCFGYDDAYENTVSYPPPFLYSYQCASTFITTYANIFILMLTMDSFLVPVLLWLIKLIHQNVSKWKSVWAIKTLERMLPNLLMEPKRIATKIDNERPLTLMKCDVLIVKLINVFAILSTFGFILPTLAVICCVAVFSVTFQSQLLIGRFISQSAELEVNAEDKRVCSELLVMLNEDCDGVRKMFINGLQMTVPFTALFFAMLLFDTLGDAVGWQRALSVPLLVCCLPVVLYIVYRYWNVIVGLELCSCRLSRVVRRSISKDTGLTYRQVQHPQDYSPLSEFEGNDTNAHGITSEIRTTLL